MIFSYQFLPQFKYMFLGTSCTIRQWKMLLRALGQEEVFLPQKHDSLSTCFSRNLTMPEQQVPLSLNT